jgi:hypothetical protein
MGDPGATRHVRCELRAKKRTQASVPAAVPEGYAERVA